MKKKLFCFSLCLIIALFFISLPNILNAQESVINPNDSKYNNGDYDLNDILSLATWGAKWILGIVGSLTLVMFIYGGFVLLTSSGSTDKVGEARKIITAAAVGLVIVFGSYMIIQFVTTSLGMSWEGKELMINK